MRSFFAFVLFVLFACPSLHAENFQCQSQEGCTAFITEEGEVVEHDFRAGDVISTQDGWILPPDAPGWVKLKADNTPPPPPPPDEEPMGWWDAFWHWVFGIALGGSALGLYAGAHAGRS